jgi:hypothetical protein
MLSPIRRRKWDLPSPRAQARACVRVGVGRRGCAGASGLCPDSDWTRSLSLLRTRIQVEVPHAPRRRTSSPKRPRTGPGGADHWQRAPRRPRPRRRSPGISPGRHGHVQLRVTVTVEGLWALGLAPAPTRAISHAATSHCGLDSELVFILLASKSHGTHQPVLLAATIVAVQATVQAAEAMRFTRSAPVHRCHPRT